jgi:hypothetical protein
LTSTVVFMHVPPCASHHTGFLHPVMLKALGVLNSAGYAQEDMNG